MPSSVTVLLSDTFCARPALATGAALTVTGAAYTVTTEERLSDLPSLTTRMME